MGRLNLRGEFTLINKKLNMNRGCNIRGGEVHVLMMEAMSARRQRSASSLQLRPVRAIGAMKMTRSMACESSRRAREKNKEA